MQNAMLNDSDPERLKEVLQQKRQTDESIREFRNKLPNFRSSYQTWYSKAHAVVKHVLPDRLADFVSYYEYPHKRAKINMHNYGIRDYLHNWQVTEILDNYLQGVRTTQGIGRSNEVPPSAAFPKFAQQLSIVKAARETLDSTLMDLHAILQADIFETEIETAGALATAGHLRAAGAICGVVIEKHLVHVLTSHNIKIKKKNPSISDFALHLRSSKVITLAKERFIQSLADTRNVCSHAKGREPIKAEIDELVEGTDKVLKTIF